jgi:Tfp pilus assembly PilM family ATPase
MGIDIGSDSIRIAVVERAKAGPRVLGLYEERVPLEPGLTEAQIYARRAKSIQDVIKREKIKTRNAVFSVPGQTVIIKRLRLPKADPERLARMISYEARQQIPFPLDKTILEYQIFDNGASNEVEVLIAAIKREFIANFMKMVTRTRLRTVAISVSSLALYNFHELNGGRRDLDEANVKRKAKEEKKAAAEALKREKAAAKKKKAAGSEPSAETGIVPEEEPLESMGFEEVQAYINLGHRLLDLAIPRTGENPMLGFPRSVPLGGENIERKIQDELGLNDELEARRIKETQVAVLGMEFELEGNPDSINMAASKAATSVVDRLVAEIRRSLDFYISQPDGVAVDSITLSGGLAAMKYLPAYLEEKLGMPVNLAEPKSPQIRLPDRMPATFYTYPTALGLAFQGAGYAQNTINFLPEDLKVARTLVERPTNLIAMIVIMLLIVLMSPLVADEPISQMRNAVTSSQTVRDQAALDDARIKTIDKRHQDVSKAYAKLGQAAGDREFWFRFMMLLRETKPGDVLIDELSLRLDGNVVLRGKSPKPQSVLDFISALDQHREMVLSTPDQIDNHETRDPRFSNGSVPVWEFVLVIKTPVRGARMRTIGTQPMTQRDMDAEVQTERNRQRNNQRR